MFRKSCFHFLAPLLALFIGCSEQSEPPVSRTSGVPGKYNVSILGDGTRVLLFKKIAYAFNALPQEEGKYLQIKFSVGNKELKLETAVEGSIENQAHLSFQADIVLLAVDATQGPLPVHREHILLAKQMAVPDIVIAFTNTHRIDDRELLELEELEMRELLNIYALPGDDASCVFDHVNAPTTPGWKTFKGPGQIGESLGILVRSRGRETNLMENTRFTATAYALALEEAFSPNIAVGICACLVKAIVGGYSVTIEIIVRDTINPGSYGEIQLLLPDARQVYQGQGFVILNQGHISAVGYFRLNR